MNDITKSDIKSYEKVVKEHVKYYAQQVTIYTWCHNILQIIILVGSISLPFLIGNAGMIQETHLPQWIPIFVSMIVAVSAGIDGYFKFGETCAKFRAVCQLITREQRLYKYEIGTYKTLTSEEDRFSKFKEQVEEYMSNLYPSKNDRAPDEISSRADTNVVPG